MSDQPLVCAIMITADRPALVQSAIRCFNAQTYPNKRLFIYDTGILPDIESGSTMFEWREPAGLTIGQLRNLAITASRGIEAEIICHLDDDDWSHPSRISEQVSLLQSSGVDAVGYREMLFWREPEKHLEQFQSGVSPFRGTRTRAITDGEAWLYTSQDPRYCLGTSLCFWRKTWEQHPFEAVDRGEDWRWLSGIKSVGIKSIIQDGWPMHFSWKAGHNSAKEAAIAGDIISYEPQGLLMASAADSLPKAEPRMIARIHSGNAHNYRPEVLAASERHGGEWQRVTDWDEYCSSIFEKEKLCA